MLPPKGKGGSQTFRAIVMFYLFQKIVQESKELDYRSNGLRLPTNRELAPIVACTT